MHQIIGIITSIITSILTSILICARNRKSARNSNPLPKRKSSFRIFLTRSLEVKTFFFFFCFTFLKWSLNLWKNQRQKPLNFSERTNQPVSRASYRYFHLALEPIRMRALQLTKAFVSSKLRALVSRSIGISTYTTVYVKTYVTRSPKFVFFLKSRYNIYRK